MKEIPNNIKVLAFEKSEHEPLNDEEQALWEEWTSGKIMESLKIRLNDPELFELIRLYNKWENNKEASWKSLEGTWCNDEMQQPLPLPKPGNRKVYFMYTIAASVLLGLTITAYYFLTKEQPAATVADTATATNAPAVSDEPIQPAEQQPGGKRATLTLADKTHRNLEKLGKGLIAWQNATAVEKASDSQIVYQVKSTNQTFKGQPYNTLTTPQGGEFKVTLPDGSNVWLNAGSSLHYPTAFTGNERRVELTGEAYFDVKKGSKPFKVITKETSIKVTGTKFNINAYAQDTISATLIEGNIQLQHGNKTIQVTQNQQAIVLGDNITLNENVNPESVIAWKNGFINLEGETASSILE